MDYQINRRSFLSHATAGAAVGATIGGAARAQPASGLAQLIDAERASIRAGMVEGEITGASVSLVSAGQIAWTEAFGTTTAAQGRPVATNTLFSIQSTSKNFTAVAVLLAVQDGLLDLDAPISRYLPDFTVRSRFGGTPRDQITLRYLLSHRAGFTHEAPVGNNYEPDTPSFEAHVRSISDTWLRFPVGNRYRYSNLGFDLAGYILEKKTGMPYAEWLKRRMFEPLGMHDSTADPAVYSKVENRAIGHQGDHKQAPLVTPLVASGGVYTTALDMAAWAMFLIDRGNSRGRQVLAPELWAEMHGFGLGGDYGLGVIRSELMFGKTPVRLLTHRGGGFGFGCAFAYCPEAKLGWAALFNRASSPGYKFGAALIEKMLTERFGPKTPRIPESALPEIRPLDGTQNALLGSYVSRYGQAVITSKAGQLSFSQDSAPTPTALRLTSPEDFFTRAADGEISSYRYHPAGDGLPSHLECFEGEASWDHNDSPSDPAGPDLPRWDRWIGKYKINVWGVPETDVTIEKKRGYLYVNGIRMIVETEPGLLFTSDGEAVDFRGKIPTWRSLLLHRVAA